MKAILAQKHPRILAFATFPMPHPKVFSNNEFLSAVSHELKTPLNAIIGFSDVLREEIASSVSVTQCLDYIAEISRAALEMKELVNDLLDVGQVASGKFSVDLSREINLKDVVRRSVKLNHDYALKRNVALKVEILEEIKPINLDEKRMKQILTNLISNSIKYSPKNTEVKISASITTGRSIVLGNTSVQEFLEIIIADQGFGMDENQVKNLFTKYQTFENPNSQKVDSFGLGLPIAKHLIEMQNGEIEVESKINQGTVMKLRFPYLM